MSISKRVRQFLDESGIPFETVAHPRTASSAETAQAAHVPGDCLAKTVVIHHEDGYALAVVPSSHRVDLGSLQNVIDRRMGLASEDEIKVLFDDCDTGAVPPLGEVYGLRTLVDSSLDKKQNIYFEGGDHKTLVKISGIHFDKLMQHCRHATFSHHL